MTSSAVRERRSPTRGGLASGLNLAASLLGEKRNLRELPTSGTTNGGKRIAESFHLLRQCIRHRSTDAGLALFTCLIGICTTSVAASDFPSKPITITVPFAAGATTDTTARVVADLLSKKLSVPTIVENKVGANGRIGATFVARSAPDGYNILLSSDSTNVLNSLLYPNLSYDPSLHLKPLALVSDLPILLVVDPRLPVTNLKEFVAHAKANPGKLNFGSPGNGGIYHLAGELFCDQAGIKLQHIAYRGGGPVMNAILGGELQAYFGVVGSALPYVNSGKLRALAVVGKTRMPALPNVPTFGEAGYPEYQVASRYGLSIPADTPQAVVDRLSEATQAVLSDPAFRKRFEAEGFLVPVKSTPSQFKAILAGDKNRWQELIRRKKFTVE